MEFEYRTIHGAAELTWLVSVSGDEIDEADVHSVQLVLVTDLETDIVYQLPHAVRWLHTTPVEQVTLHGCTWRPCTLSFDEFHWWFSGRSLITQAEELIWDNIDDEAV